MKIKLSYFRQILLANKMAIILILLPFHAFLQESKVSLNGYVKELYMFYSPENPISGIDLDYLSTNIVHNRLTYTTFLRKFRRYCESIGWLVLCCPCIYLFTAKQFGTYAYRTTVLWRCRNRIWRYRPNCFRKVEMELLRE